MERSGQESSVSKGPNILAFDEELVVLMEASESGWLVGDDLVEAEMEPEVENEELKPNREGLVSVVLELPKRSRTVEESSSRVISRTEKRKVTSENGGKCKTQQSLLCTSYLELASCDIPKDEDDDGSGKA